MVSHCPTGGESQLWAQRYVALLCLAVESRLGAYGFPLFAAFVQIVVMCLLVIREQPQYVIPATSDKV